MLFTPGANGPGARGSGITPITPGNRMGRGSNQNASSFIRRNGALPGGSPAAGLRLQGLVFQTAPVRTLPPGGRRGDRDDGDWDRSMTDNLTCKENAIRDKF